jgi:hypothetical protein
MGSPNKRNAWGMKSGAGESLDDKMGNKWTKINMVFRTIYWEM